MIYQESADIHKPSGLYNLEGIHREDNTVQENHAKWPFPRDLQFSSDGKHVPEFIDDFPLMIQFYDFSESYPITPNYHAYFEILYTYSGAGVFHIDRHEAMILISIISGLSSTVALNLSIRFLLSLIKINSFGLNLRLPG